MAARLVDDPSQAEAMRQRLQECVCVSRWSDEELLRRLAKKLDQELPGAEVWVVDDTGLPKKGELSVGVARQYSGTLGRTDNCQVITSLHVAGERGSGCIGLRLYLPKEWTDDPKRCRAAGVPEAVHFQTKWQLALGEIDQAIAWGLQRRPVLADAGYGEIPEFREGLAGRGLVYVVGIPANHLVWPPDADPRPPTRTEKRGRPRTHWRDEEMQPIQIARLVEGIPRQRFKTVTWREGARGKLSSKFLAYRVRPAEKHTKGKLPAEEQWLLCEWPDGDAAPKFHLSTLPKHLSLRQLVRIAKMRWRVERDYQDLKGEVGLDHFEGRSWRGLHHHATLCAVAHGFLALRRALFPPEPNEVDTAGGQKTPPADPASPNRLVPALLPAADDAVTPARTVQDLT
jgi:SRSO17 transposase